MFEALLPTPAPVRSTRRAGLIRALAATALLACSCSPATPALARDYALVPPSHAAAMGARGHDPAAGEVIATAQSQLGLQANPIPTIRVHGLLPHEGQQDESNAATADFPAALNLALAADLTGDPRYGTAAAGLLGPWFNQYKPDYSPIDETRFGTLVLAMDLLPPAAFEQARRAGYDAFLRRLCEGYLLRMRSGHVPSPVNNWQSHRVKIVALTAFALNDPALIAQAKQAFVQQLQTNIAADSETYDFRQRDAIHYVVYDLEPLVMAALAAKEHGQDWYSLQAPSGASLRGALDWLAPYATGEKTHQEFVNTTVEFDRKRAAAGLRSFNEATVRPNSANFLYDMAARLDPRYEPIRRRSPKEQPWLHFALPD